MGASLTAAGRRMLPAMLRSEDGLPQLLAFNAAVFGGGAGHALFGAAKAAEFTRDIEQNVSKAKEALDRKAVSETKGIA